MLAEGVEQVLMGIAAAHAGLVNAQTTPLTGSHTDLPRWCGKPYELGAPNYDPGGALSPPAPQPSDMLLVQMVPRHSIYVEGESTGQFVVDAALSRIQGQALPSDNRSSPFDMLYFTISAQPSSNTSSSSTTKFLASGSLPVNTTANLVNFPLSHLTPQRDPYPIVLSAGPTSDATSTYHATSQLYYLPAKTSGGSMVKIDNLYSSLLFANPSTGYAFRPLLPYGFYADCSSYLQTSAANVSAYAALSFTAVNPVCALPDNETGVTTMLDWLDATDVRYQYDMRGSFFDLDSVTAQAAAVADRPGLLSWYTADEPDGWQYNPASVTGAYALLKRLDPYHPASLVLNCEDYYFDQYAGVGATDIVMEDAYPVGINATWSKWGTACNATYGDCGCDNCAGSLADVAARLDDLDAYQDWMPGRAASLRAPLWAVLQAFSGEGYWSRQPTPGEAWVMTVLAFNHRAKGVMSWLFPPTSNLADAHSSMAKVVTVSPALDFLTGAHPAAVQVGSASLDVAYWKLGACIMVGLANVDATDLNETVSVPLPDKVAGIASQLWGSLSWTVTDRALEVDGVPATGTSFVVVDVA